MKKILFILFILICQVYSQSNNVVTNPTGFYYHDTLTTSIDTMDIAFDDALDIDYYSISIYTSTGADTVNVFTKSKDSRIWTQKAVYNTATGAAAAASIPVSTTPIEWIINDPDPVRIRLISTSNDASTTLFTIQGKKGIYK